MTRLYVRSTRNGSMSYSIHDGMSEQVVTQLLSELGATDIQFITEADYQAGTAR